MQLPVPYGRVDVTVDTVVEREGLRIDGIQRSVMGEVIEVRERAFAELHKPRLDSFDVYHLGDPPGPRRAHVWVGLGPHIIVEFEQGEPVAPGTRYPKVGLQIQGSRVVGRLMTRPTGEIETQMTRDVYSEE